MQQFVCDKCGAAIVRPQSKYMIGYEPYYLRLRILGGDTVERSEITSNVDLCNRCWDLFNDWLIEKPKEGKHGRNCC